MSASVAPVDVFQCLAPVLPALPAAAASAEPAAGVLPLLSPVLRQRLQLFSASGSDPWLRWLCYDTAKAAKLSDAVRNPALEPHPVSGEVEIDWDCDAETRYRRADSETLQALVVLTALDIAFQMVYCVGDPEGGGDGWRIGEVTVADRPSPFSVFGGVSSIAEAERQFKEGQADKKAPPKPNGATPTINNNPGANLSNNNDDDDESDGYWDRYDATPNRTPGQSPAQKTSPAPRSSMNVGQSAYDDDDHYAQYDSVQPAMDNHDPDEEAQFEEVAPSLGLGRSAQSQDAPAADEEGSSTMGGLGGINGLGDSDSRTAAGLLHPRPDSASSNGSGTVARLEATADRQGQNEFGVKQHVSRSLRSLYLLSRASGIDREEFERLVRTELDILAVLEDQEL